MKDLDELIEEAIKDGLSNHTGEWFNGFIAPGLNLNEEQLRDLLFYLTKAKRLNKNIKNLITSHFIPKQELSRLLEETHVKVPHSLIELQKAFDNGANSVRQELKKELGL